MLGTLRFSPTRSWQRGGERTAHAAGDGRRALSLTSWPASTYEALNLRALFKAANGAGEPERKGEGGATGQGPPL